LDNFGAPGVCSRFSAALPPLLFTATTLPPGNMERH
jgi:hypothetical protein